MKTPMRSITALGLGSFTVWALVTGTNSSAQSQERTPAAPRYQVTDLGTFPGREITRVSDINDAGVMVGNALDYSGKNLAALVWKEGKPTRLPAPSGYRSAEANGVNASGQIAGSLEKTDRGVTLVYGCLWTGRKPRVLPTPRSRHGAATDVNAAGVVVGWSSTGRPARPRAWRWEGGRLALLPVPAGRSVTRECALNDAGQIVGVAEREGDAVDGQAVLWDGGRVTELPGLGGELEAASGINRHGHSVGNVQTREGEFHAARWAAPGEGGRMTDLGTLGGPVGLALGINDSGQVVGTSELPRIIRSGSNFIEGDERGFLWENGKMWDLNALLPVDSGWKVISAVAINNRGQIVGQGRLNERTRPVLLTPLPL